MGLTLILAFTYLRAPRGLGQKDAMIANTSELIRRGRFARTHGSIAAFRTLKSFFISLLDTHLMKQASNVLTLLRKPQQHGKVRGDLVAAPRLEI